MTGAAALWCGSVALACAALAVTRPSVAHGLMWLVATLLALAGAFFALGAPFAGAVQILIYAGAILAVFVFVIMTFDSSPEALSQERARLRAAWKAPLATVALILLPLLPGLWRDAALPGAEGGPVAAARLGALLFGPWAVAVEIASCLLLAALLGARALGRGDDARGPQP